MPGPTIEQEKEKKTQKVPLNKKSIKCSLTKTNAKLKISNEKKTTTAKANQSSYIIALSTNKI